MTLHLDILSRRVLAALAVFLVLAGTFAPGADSAPEEKLKTAFIFQFAKYIEWPDEKDETSFSISLVGASPMWKFLQELAAEKRIREKPIELRNVTSVLDLPKSNVVILSAAEGESISQILRKTKGSHALTVGHGDGLAEKGVMINFFITEEGKLRFEINRAAAEAEGLVISSQLLKLAKIID